jgi:putative membrane protein
MKRIFTLSALTTISCLVAGTGAAFADSGFGYGGYGNHPMMWGNMFIGPMMMLLMIVVVVAAAIFVLKLFGHGGQGNGSTTHDRALAVLGERFAKGEIDKTEYEDRKKTLGA